MNYREIEQRFNVIYPLNEKATYKSKLNYSEDLTRPFQRWCRYKEGYSVSLVKSLINKYCTNLDGVILDPFLGSGTTLIAANDLGMRGCGFEVNPFSFHLSSCKLDSYSQEDITHLEHLFKTLATSNNEADYSLPKLSIAHKVFSKDIELYYMRMLELLNNSTYPSKVKQLARLAIISCVEELSLYKKAGNGLKKRVYKRKEPVTLEGAKLILRREFDIILEDLKEAKQKSAANNIYNETCKNISNNCPKESISGIVFSPPYANCFDYAEIYKLELWFGGYVKEYSDLKKLRAMSLRSNLNGDLCANDYPRLTESVLSLTEKLSHCKLWDKRIISMLKGYYEDMFEVIDNCYNVLERGGFCSIVVGNSSYGGVVFPTDLLLAEYAQSIGFEVDCVDVDRYIITSSQQYNLTKDDGAFLRESIVCLKKHQ